MTLSETLCLNDTTYQLRQMTETLRYSGWRALHMAEGGDEHYVGAPAVHPSDSIAGVPFTSDMQWLSYNINSFNPLLTKSKWRNVWSNGTAFTNNNGFSKPGDPRVDYVNRIDIGYPLPRVMRALICSGSFYRGVVEGNYLVMYPGIHGVDVSKPMPEPAEVIARNWYFCAVSADDSAATHFTQGGGAEVRIPLFLKVPTRYPRAWFEPWDREYLPDPIRFYL